jgi:hypothetical protein
MATVAAQETKVPIYLQATTEDTIGTTYLYQLREQLRASHSYRLVLTEGEALFHVRLVTIDPDDAPVRRRRSRPSR